MKIEGGCLCGKIRYHAQAPPLGVVSPLICFDADHGDWGARLARARAALVLQPARTWGSLAHMHARGNAMRAVEEGVAWLDAGQNARLSEIIATSFERHGFVHPRDATERWAGINGVIKPLGSGATFAFEIQAAASAFMLCVYRNCGIDRNHTPRPVKPTFDPNTVLHSPENSAGKINYQIVLTDDQELWVTQNCFKCGGEHGHKMQFICPVVVPPGMCLRSHVMLPPADAPAPTPEEPDPDERARVLARYKKEWAKYYIPKVIMIVDGKPVRVIP
jgi:hypothetical protein